MDRVISAGDQVIVVAEDDDTVALNPAPASFPPGNGKVAAAAKAQPERTLVLGWNVKGEMIVRELDAYVPEGSVVMIVAASEHAAEQVKQLQPELKRQGVRFVHGDTTERTILEKSQPDKFNHIILLSDTEIDMQEADAKTLITLLHLRKLSESAGQRFSIVSEMRDVRNRALAEVAQPDDFIVSDKLISLLLSQISENKHLDAVFRDLLDPDGSEIYLKPITNYVVPGQPVNFYTLIDAAAARGETAIGYRVVAKANKSDEGFGVKINPDKAATITFAAEDKLVVLAEE